MASHRALSGGRRRSCVFNSHLKEQIEMAKNFQIPLELKEIYTALAPVAVVFTAVQRVAEGLLFFSTRPRSD